MLLLIIPYIVMNEKDYPPKMHTAEHLLNGYMDKTFGCGRSFNSHIEKKKSKCDYKLGRDLTHEEVENLSYTMSKLIEDDLLVAEEIVLYENALKMVDLSRVPQEKNETIRLVKIGDYDICACIGQHVASTREIGVFKLVSHTYDGEKLRIRFKIE